MGGSATRFAEIFPIWQFNILSLAIFGMFISHLAIFVPYLENLAQIFIAVNGQKLLRQFSHQVTLNCATEKQTNPKRSLGSK